MHVTFDEGNSVTFNFPSISLPDSSVNGTESLGFVKYAIRSLPDIQSGSVIRNTAYINFDSNAPIITNTTETLVDLSNVTEWIDKHNFIVYPNPTYGTVKLLEYANATVSVSLTDLSGKTVSVQTCVNGELDLSSLNQGVYLGVIHATQGQQARRFKVVKM